MYLSITCDKEDGPSGFACTTMSNLCILKGEGVKGMEDCKGCMLN